MEEKRNVPKLRFPGFTDPWEQRKLGELYVERGEDGFEGLPILSVSIHSGVSSGQLGTDDLGKDVRRIADKSLYKKVEAGDLVLNMMRAWQGAIGSAEANGMVSPAYIVAKPLDDLDQSFTNVLLRRQALVSQIDSLSYGVTDFRKRIYWPSLIKAEICLPSRLEQSRIGALFAKLDSLIALHQRELDHIKELKKSLLQKMFPKEGTSVPELRFPGFTDPWEQRKLGEIAHRVTRKNEEGASDLPLTISAQHGLVDQRDFFGSQVASRDMRGYYLLEKGEFAYNKSTSGDSPWGAVKRLARYEKGCLSTLYICFGLDKGDPAFLVTYYETNRWHKGIRLIAAEGARNHGLLNIAPSDFFETELTLPSGIEEQRQIGALFAKLDSLIALHQRELDHIKELKKGLLQQMFV